MTAHLVVHAAWTHDRNTEEDTVTIPVDPEPGEDADDLAWRYDAAITAALPAHWGDWDLLSAEVVG